MIGAIIGDIAGSVFERHNVKNKDICIFAKRVGYTDDSLMTIAVAKALTNGKKNGFIGDADAMQKEFVTVMQYIGRKYPPQRGGYGRAFKAWLKADYPKPYGSFGNGSAMRVSPCGHAGDSLERALDISKWSAEVSHDHPEGIKGAQTIGGCVYLARTGANMNAIRDFAGERYDLGFTLDDIRPGYVFDTSCQGSVPQAVAAFLESKSFDDAIRNAISIGGDSDTIAAMAGSIAWPYYERNGGVTPKMESMWNKARSLLPDDLLGWTDDFLKMFDN